MKCRRLVTGGIFVALAAAMVFAEGHTGATKSVTTVGMDLSASNPLRTYSTGCCAGSTGNVDCDGSDGVDISDLSGLIDFLYISFTPLCCPDEANVDGDSGGGIDISDLSALIDYLYISFTPPAPCAVEVVFSSYSGQIQPIFTANCAVNGCHTGVAPVADLKLSDGESYANLINVASTGYAPAIRVVPSNTAASVLWHKVNGTGVYGPQMPAVGSLTSAEIALIGAWIAAGAPNN